MFSHRAGNAAGLREKGATLAMGILRKEMPFENEEKQKS